MAFGEWLAREFKARGMTMAEGARQIGVSQAAVSNWVRGQRRPDTGSIGRLADVLGLPVEVVLDAVIRPETPRQNDADGSSKSALPDELKAWQMTGWQFPDAFTQRSGRTRFESEHAAFRTGFALGRESALAEIRRTLWLMKALPLDEQTVKSVRPLLDTIVAAFEHGEPTIDKTNQEE